MLTSKGCNKKIDRIHKKSLKSIHNDDESSLYDMLSTLNKKTIHQRCINVLLTKIYKYPNGLSPND